MVRMRGAASNPLVSGAPAIDFEAFAIIDATNPSQLEYTIYGKHDGFPAYDFLIDCEEVYYYPVPQGRDALELGGRMDQFIPPKTCTAGSCGTVYSCP